jgi:hypothetical protein
MAGDFNYLLPPQMWEATVNLPERISGIIGEMGIQNFSDLRGFINFVSSYKAMQGVSATLKLRRMKPRL